MTMILEPLLNFHTWLLEILRCIEVDIGNQNAYFIMFMTKILILFQEEINECDSYPCQHGGTCTDEMNDYTCNCTEGFEGKNCEMVRNYCGGSPCQNEGECYNLFTDFFCRYIFHTSKISTYLVKTCRYYNSCILIMLRFFFVNLSQLK